VAIRSAGQPLPQDIARTCIAAATAGLLPTLQFGTYHKNSGTPDCSSWRFRATRSFDLSGIHLPKVADIPAAISRPPPPRPCQLAHGQTTMRPPAALPPPDWRAAFEGYSCARGSPEGVGPLPNSRFRAGRLAVYRPDPGHLADQLASNRRSARCDRDVVAVIAVPSRKHLARCLCPRRQDSTPWWCAVTPPVLMRLRAV